MKPPWLNQSQDAELEALQTDVMRFIAILGLCLAAIFSLVQSATLEKTTELPPAVVKITGQEGRAPPAAVLVPRQESVSPTLSPAPPKTASDSKPEAKPEPEPTQKPVDKQLGFTLEFASVEALHSLLKSGEVQLYADVNNQFWSLDRGGQFVQSEAPVSYYQMHPDTVPQRYRESLTVFEVGVSAAWGVTLPESIVGQIGQLTAGRQGGNLIIAKDGIVGIDAHPSR